MPTTLADAHFASLHGRSNTGISQLTASVSVEKKLFACEDAPNAKQYGSMNLCLVAIRRAGLNKSISFKRRIWVLTGTHFFVIMIYMPYVSRAGEKLEHALKVFSISVQNLVCADFGSNTGGFVDVLLAYGAKKVYSVETGYGVLDWKLRQDSRVVVMERENAMHVELSEKMDFISIDTSWTKLEKIISNALLNLKPNGSIVALVKPHYESEPHMLRKGKLPEESIPQVLENTKNKLKEFNLEILGETESPIEGGKAKNKEFLLYLKRGESTL